MTDTHENKREMLRTALRQLQSGLDLLDEACAPGDIGAHVDLAACKLESLIASTVKESEHSEH